jgi:hypothetical protein
MAEQAKNPGLDAIRVLLVTFLPVTAERRERWALWLAFASRASADPKTFQELVTRYDTWRSLVKRSLIAAQKRGEMPADLDPGGEAQVLVAFVDGIGRQAALEPKRWPRRLLVETVERYLARLSVELRRAA